MGASSSFDAFYAAEYAPVVRLVAAMVGRLDVAEEIAQEVFVTAHDRWSTVREYERPDAWVRRVAVNRATSLLRRRATEARLLLRLGNRPAQPNDVSEPSDRTWAAVRSLPRRQAQVVALVYLEDRDVGDVASILGCSVDTVRTHLRRAHDSLARTLRDPADDSHAPRLRHPLAEEGR